MRRGIALVAIVGVMALVAAACSNNSSSSSGGDSATALSYDPSAQGEGELNLVAWPLYAEKDVTQPFENATGCQVNVKEANTSDEMVNLMSQGGGTQYDGVSASGDASLRLIAAGSIAPVNVDSFPDFGNVMHVAAVAGAQHGERRALRRAVRVGPEHPDVQQRTSSRPAPKSWDITFEPQINGQANPYAGKITGYDSPIFIADAAMYLMAHQPDLGITDPYELTSDQLDAAINLLKQQNGLVSKYWNVWSDEVDAFESGDMVAGTAWPANQNVLISDAKVNVASVTPDEGVTGWADTWMMSSNAPHPNCMLAWMNYTLSDKVQAATAYTFGATPSVTTACKGLKANLIAGYGQEVGTNAYPLYHCGDDSYLSSIYLWKTPVPDCGNGSTDCTDYNTWTQKWFEVRGAIDR